jgi:5-methylcytosine-specific restriction endonuclease McrA
VPQKTCADCGSSYEATGRNQKRCSSCAHEVAVARSRAYYDKFYRTGQGSGGNQQGENNHQWKGGTSPKIYRRTKFESTTDRKCERCGVDLSGVIGTRYGRGLWTVHHKDGDDTNRSPENLELLCKRCHQTEHRCWENFSAKV